MKKTLKLTLTALLLVINLSVVFPSTAFAHEEGTNQKHEHTNTEQAGQPQTSGNYEFITPKGCSLTLLVRRSLQLFDQEQPSIELSPAAILYAETNIVKQMGERRLEVGERVSVDKKLLDEFARSSATLSPSALKRWQQYAARVTFALDHLQPINVTGTSSTNTEEDSNTGQAEEQAESQQALLDPNQPGSGTDDKTQTQQQSTESKAEVTDQRLLAWLISVSVIAIVYFLARSPAPPPRT